MISSLLKSLMALIFYMVAFVIFTFGPILVAIYLKDPMYLFTYLISWAPSLFFSALGYIVSEM